MSASLTGRSASEATRRAQSQRLRGLMEDPAKKAEYVARLTGIKPLEPRVRSIATRRGADYVRSNLDRYTEQWAAEFSLGKPTVRSIILRAIGDPVAPRAGKTLKGSKADMIRELAASGRTTAQIVQEGIKRDQAGEVGWGYKYVYNVLDRARAAAS